MCIQMDCTEQKDMGTHMLHTNTHINRLVLVFLHIHRPQTWHTLTHLYITYYHTHTHSLTDPHRDRLCSQVCHHVPLHLTSWQSYNCWQGVMEHATKRTPPPKTPNCLTLPLPTDPPFSHSQHCIIWSSEV